MHCCERAAIRSENLDGIDALIGALQDARIAIKQKKDFSGAIRSDSLVAPAKLPMNSKCSGAALSKTTFPGSSGADADIFLEACPIDVSGMLRDRLFTRVPTCVLTSATLTVAESFDYMRTRLGFNEGEELSLATEFNVRKQALLYIPKGMPDYRHPSYLDRAAEEIRSILRASQGRAFVLFTSYRQMETLYDSALATIFLIPA